MTSNRFSRRPRVQPPPKICRSKTRHPWVGPCTRARPDQPGLELFVEPAYPDDPAAMFTSPTEPATHEGGKTWNRWTWEAWIPAAPPWGPFTFIVECNATGFTINGLDAYGLDVDHHGTLFGTQVIPLGTATPDHQFGDREIGITWGTPQPPTPG